MSIYEISSEVGLDFMYVSLYEYSLWYVSVFVMDVALDWKLMDRWDCIPSTWCKRPSMLVCVCYCLVVILVTGWLLLGLMYIWKSCQKSCFIIWGASKFREYCVFWIKKKLNLEENWCRKSTSDIEIEIWLILFFYFKTEKL